MATFQAVDENLKATDDVNKAIKGFRRNTALSKSKEVMALIQEPGKPVIKIKPRGR